MLTGSGDKSDRLDRKLDMELEQSFPASDPIPWIHESGARSDPGRAADQRAELRLGDLTIGQRFFGGPRTVSKDEIKSFASTFDPQPFHLDERAAADSIFAGLAASGWHTAALTMRLLVDSELRIAGGLLGVGGEISWPRPARPGDALRIECEVLEIRPSTSKPDRGIVTMRMQTLNQRNEPVQIAVMKMLVPR